MIAAAEPTSLNIWVIALSSAGIAAIVSGAIAEIGKWRERTARRNELLFEKAVEIALAIYDGVVQLSVGGRPTNMKPLALILEESYRSAQHLFRHGKIDPITLAEIEAEMAKRKQ